MKPRRRRRAFLAVLGALLAGVPLVLFALIWLAPSVPSIAMRYAMAFRYGAKIGTVQAGDATLAYTELGDAKARPLVMIHGLGGESVALLPLAKELAQRGYRAIMIDLPGSGRSPRLSRPLELDDAGRYALEAARARGSGDRPAILGHSLGGWIVAWQALEHPEHCGPVILTAAAGMNFSPPPLDVLMPRTVAAGRENSKLLFANPPWIPTPVLWAAVRRPRPANFEMLRSALSGRFLLDGLLPGMTEPALVLAASNDGIVPPSASRAMAAQIPGAEYVEFKGAAHMLIWEKPAQIAEVVDRFLRAHPGAASDVHSTAAAPADETRRLPPSFPAEAARKVEDLVTKDPSVAADFRQLWDIDRLLGSTLPPLSTKPVDGRPARTLSEGRRLVVLAITSCPGSVEQVALLAKQGFKHALADDVVVLVDPEWWHDYKALIPGIERQGANVHFIDQPLPGRLAQLKATPVTLLVDDGLILAGCVGPESNAFGAWQWPGGRSLAGGDRR